MKKNHKKIIILLLMLVVSFAVLSTVNAAITSSTIIESAGSTDEHEEIVNGSTTTTATPGGKAFKIIATVLGYIGNMAMSGVGAFITPLINALSITMWLTIEGIFRFGTGSWSSPMPDSVVFNKVPILDANFINPHEHSLIKEIGGNLFVNLFESFVVIAEAVFVIAAMVTGLKLALSTIAAKKAQYKEAVMKWVAGFAILLCLRWLLAGVFYLNEQLVAKLAAMTKLSSVKIPIYPADAIPIIGKLITDISKAISSLWGGSGLVLWGTGYYGIIAANLLKSIGGNIVASIVTFVLIGQVTIVLSSYIKRVFMCLLLGVVSPLIVAVDTITGIAGQKSTVFKSWLKNFVFTVFTQSFHAAYMVIIFYILSAIYRDTWGNYTIQSIVTITLTTGLVKMEKVLKGMFGFGDSMAGSLSDGKKGMKKAMGAVAGIAAAAKSLGDNKTKLQDATKRRQAIGKEQASLKAGLDREKNAHQAARQAKASGNMTEYHKQMKIAADQRRINMGHTGGGSSRGSSGGSNNSVDYLASVINKQSQPQTAQEKLQVLGEAEAKARADEKSALFASVMGIPNLAAGIGLGIGMDDDIGDSLFKGGMITAALDRGAEGVGRRMADKDRKSVYEREKADGQEYGYTASEKIKREKTVVDAVLTFDIPKVKENLTKQFSDLGYVFTDQVKREMKNIDKDLDNE